MFGASSLPLLMCSFPPIRLSSKLCTSSVLNVGASGLRSYSIRTLTMRLGVSQPIGTGSELDREEDLAGTRATRFRAGRDFATTRLISSSISLASVALTWAALSSIRKAQRAAGEQR